MDVLTCVALSLGETYACSRLYNLKLSSTTFIFIALTQYFVLKFYRIYLWPRYFSSLRHVPRPTDDHYLLGQAYNLYNSGPAERHLSWSKQFPNSTVIRFFDIGNHEGVLLNSVKATKDVLQTQCYKFVKPRFIRRVLGEIIGTGLFFEEGDRHKKQRKLLVGPFSFGNIKKLLSFFDDKGYELTSVIKRTIGSRPNDLVEVSSLFSKTTLDVIGLACLGINMNNLSNPSEFALAYEVVFRNTAWSAIMSALNIYLPIRKLIPIKANRDYLAANATIRTLLRQHIQKRRAELEGKDKASVDDKDVLSVMIKERGQGAEIWTEDEILGHLLNFMAAGHETTAGSLTLSLYLLSKYPKIQARLQTEILHNFPSPEQLEVGGIEKLNYLKNFTNEVLRYYAPGIIGHREAAEDVIIDGVPVPRGTLIHIVPAVIHHSESIWGPTVEEFDPDRWDNLPKEATDPFASGSFLNGPRICVGKSFALLEYKTIMIRLLQNFTFEDPAGLPLTFERGGVSLRPQGGLYLKINPLHAYRIDNLS